MELLIDDAEMNPPFKDPLLRYVYGFAMLVELEPDYLGITELDTLFTFLQQCMGEFMKANPEYRKPAGLELCYCRPSCCPPTIRVGYLDQKFTIKYKNNEKNPADNDSADALQHRP